MTSKAIIQREIKKYNLCAAMCKSEENRMFYLEKVSLFQQVLNDLKSK